MKRILPLLLFPTAALAHPGHVDGSPLAAGWLHPLGGTDHVLAMVAVGLWAATAAQGPGAGRGAGRGADRRGLWALPLAFVAAMVAGGALGAAGVHLPGVEPVILASGIVLGLAVALALRPALGMALPAVAVFGLMHGHAHGVEGPAHGLMAYALGFVLATAALHLAGIGLGRLGMARWLGGLTAAAGAALAVMA